MSTHKIYLGFDPGKSGAIVALFPDGTVHTSATPTSGSGKGKEINKQALKNILNDFKQAAWQEEKSPAIVAVLEDVHSIFGVSAGSNFQFGRALGILEGLLEALEIPYYKVAPKTWQGVCFEGVPVIEKPGTKAKGKARYDTKSMAAIAAQRLYPTVDLRKSERAKNAHDGIIDALLMAHYAKLKY